MDLADMKSVTYETLIQRINERNQADGHGLLGHKPVQDPPGTIPEDTGATDQGGKLEELLLRNQEEYTGELTLAMQAGWSELDALEMNRHLLMKLSYDLDKEPGED